MSSFNTSGNPVRPVDIDTDGSCVWEDEVTKERFNSATPPTDAERAEIMLAKRRRWFANFVAHVNPTGRYLGDLGTYDMNFGVIAGRHWECWAYAVNPDAAADLDPEVDDVVNNADDVNPFERYCAIVQNDSHQSTYPLFASDLREMSRILATLTDSGDCMDEAFALGVWDLETGNALQPFERHYFTFKPTEDDRQKFAQEDYSVPDRDIALWLAAEAVQQEILAQDFERHGAAQSLKAAELCRERADKLDQAAKLLGL